jgi:hypothetical protein
MFDGKQSLSEITGERSKQIHLMSQMTAGVTRGVCRFLATMGIASLVEFRLPNRRRVDIIGMDPAGNFTIIEIKVSLADYRADRKWPDYLPYCDKFYFGIPVDFPAGIIPKEYGLIIADPYGAVIRQEPRDHMMTGQRRKKLQIKFALTAAERLQSLTDRRI